MSRPILYSFRRCPYAMRARLAIASSGVQVDLREVLLRDKPEAFLEASPSATVPCLKLGDRVIDESLDIMVWSLDQSDPEGWLLMPEDGHGLIDEADGPFKSALDRYKYPSRYDAEEGEGARDRAADFIHVLDDTLGDGSWLFGDAPTLADMAILPFVRQYAHVDLDWFAGQSWTAAQAWLERFKTSARFAAIMAKYPQWHPEDPSQRFPELRAQNA